MSIADYPSSSPGGRGFLGTWSVVDAKLSSAEPGRLHRESPVTSGFIGLITRWSRDCAYPRHYDRRSGAHLVQGCRRPETKLALTRESVGAPVLGVRSEAPFGRTFRMLRLGYPPPLHDQRSVTIHLSVAARMRSVT